MNAQSLLVLVSSVLAVFLGGQALADEAQSAMVRLAKLEIHPDHLEAYKAALKEEIEASIRLEPGVIALRAVSEKENPTRITIMETYASVAAYKAHIESPHFQKYKAGTQHMVKSLELVEVDPILLGEKPK
jgi:quinol monooxygenase YgiN